MKLTTPSGKTYALYEEMTEQPHLLIAGASGSGKSVILHGLIATLMYKFPTMANGAQFILLDPKRVELSQYKELPHTIAYVGGYDQYGWLRVLNNAVSTMDSRYRMMEIERKRMYDGADLYVIIDEFATLITNDLRGKPILNAIQRLSCEGRAARVHLVIATQTPKAEVLPTRIRCNLDWVMALRTNNANGSRLIMGKNGCENLPLYGQGYWCTPEGTIRYNIPYIEPQETERLVNWWLCQAHALTGSKMPQNGTRYGRQPTTFRNAINRI